MPIPMQGSWTVSVKSKEGGSAPSRFIITGAATGNGTYVGNTTTPPVHVTGAAWSIDFQHNPASSFVESFFEIGFPTNNGTHYTFDIKISDFPASVDPDFDDLILACTTPVTQNDFIVFGNVSWYADCIFTPCHRFPSVVIDSAVALQAALQRPALRKVIQSLYPERVYPKPVGPHPDPGPFRPFLLPVGDNPIVPAQQVSVFADTAGLTEAAAATPASQLVTVNVPSVSPAVSLSALEAASLFIPNRFCQSGALAQFVLDFWDYTPTASEAAGGPYTGTGARNLLGVTTTDLLGNYVFRFTRPCERFRAFSLQQLQQLTIPFPRCIVPLPNVIVQVLDGATLVYETTPYWSEPHYAEFNICVPKGEVTTSPACIGRRPNPIPGDHSEYRQHHHGSLASKRNADHRQHDSDRSRHRHRQRFAWPTDQLPRRLGRILVFLRLPEQHSHRPLYDTIRPHARDRRQLRARRLQPLPNNPGVPLRDTAVRRPHDRSTRNGSRRASWRAQSGSFLPQRADRYHDALAGTLDGPEDGAHQFHLSAGAGRRRPNRVPYSGLR